MPFTALDLITVKGKYLTMKGDPAAGRISFRPSVIVTDTVNDEIVFPVVIKVDLSVTGEFSIQIPATDDPDLSPQGWTYTVTEEITGALAPRTFEIEVPHNTPGGVLNMADLVPAATVPAVETYVLVSNFNDAINQRVAVERALARMGFARFDDWDRPNADFVDSKRMASNDFDWVIATTVVGNRAAKIREGALYFESDGAGYYYTVGRPYSRISAEFSFDAGPVSNPTALAQIGVISSKKTGPDVTGAQGIATNSIHFVVNPEDWSIGIFDGVQLRNWVSRQVHANGPLDIDKPYRCGIERLAHDRIRVHLPSGPSQDFTDAQIQAVIGSGWRIDDWWGDTALLEHFHPAASYATDRKLAIHSFGVSGTGTLRTHGLRHRPGWWTHAGIVPAASNMALNNMYVMPLDLGEPMNFNLASLDVTTAVAGSTTRGVVYGDDGTGYPGDLLWTGILDVSALGQPEIATAFRGRVPRIWPGALAQGAAPGVRFSFGTHHPATTPTKPANLYSGSLVVTNVLADPPAVFPAGAFATNGCPRLALRME